MPSFVIHLIAGENNQTATDFLRIMAFLPTIAALNSLNVLDLLLKNDTISIFRIAIILMLLSMLTAWFLVTRGLYQYFGAYALLIESTALLLYEYVIKKKSERNG
jgi:O-antigen/teichoic acid export membrane protein